MSDSIRQCLTCGLILTRNTTKSGKLEFPVHFRKRQYCNQFCYQRSPALKARLVDPEQQQKIAAINRSQRRREESRQTILGLWDKGIIKPYQDMAKNRTRDWNGLTDAQITAIRSDTRIRDLIATEYKISPTLISHIKQKRIYTHIEGEAFQRKPGKVGIFTDDEVRRIRADRRSLLDIAASYSRSDSSIWGIKHLKYYQEVSGPPPFLNKQGDHRSTKGIARPQTMGARHPMSKAVITPAGRFASQSLAGEHYGISKQAVAAKIRRHTVGWSYDE